MTTVLDPIQMPPPIEEHRLVKRHSRRREELETKLAAVTARRSDLVRERQELQRANHRDNVNTLLEGGLLNEKDTARVTQLDAAIASATLEEAATREALEMHNTIADGARAQAEAEVRQEVASTVTAVLKGMIPIVTELSTQSQQLMVLATKRAPGVLVPNPAFLETWLDQARRLVGE